jgi:hypothetical protein
MTDAQALMAARDFAAAGAALRDAVGAGQTLKQLPLQMKLALQDHLRLAAPENDALQAIDAAIAAEFGVLDERAGVLYTYSPKVACTVLKATVIMNSPRRAAYLASGLAIHDFVWRDRDEAKLLAALAAPKTFRFAVLRDPAARSLSAYLNKFVTTPAGEPPGLSRYKKIAVRIGQQIAGVPDDPARGISFAEFVHFLARADDLDMDPHWIPQTRIIGADLRGYDHIGRFEALDETFDLLEQIFGYTAERESAPHLNGQKNHATRYNAAVAPEAPSLLLPAALQRLGGVFPAADAFLTAELREILVRRYTADAALHAAAG